MEVEVDAVREVLGDSVDPEGKKLAVADEGEFPPPPPPPHAPSILRFRWRCCSPSGRGDAGGCIRGGEGEEGCESSGGDMTMLGRGEREFA